MHANFTFSGDWKYDKEWQDFSDSNDIPMLRYGAASYDGSSKYDYGNGLIKVSLTGSQGWKYSTDWINVPLQYRRPDAGYRLLGKRRGIDINGTQQIEWFWFGNEQDQKEEYNEIIDTLGSPMERTGYLGGKPCNPTNDRNNDTTRKRVDSGKVHQER